MDARSLVLLLTLFLGTAISLKGAQASTDGCSVPDREAHINPNDTSKGIFCYILGTKWTIGNDLCDPSSFMEYRRCSGSNICEVSESDYLVEGPTFVCCHEGQQRECHEIIITPKTLHQVPPIVRIGRTETVYTIITSKPRPAETASGVVVQLLIKNVTIMSLNVSTVLASDPMDVTKYVAIHTFNVPSDIDVKMGFTVRFEFIQPSNWTFLDDNVPPVVPVVRGYLSSFTSYPATQPRSPPTHMRRLDQVPGADPSTQPTYMTEPSTEGREDASSTSACLGPGTLAALAAACAVALTVIAVCFIGCVCLLKYKQRVKKSNNHYVDPRTATPSAPNKLPLPPSPGTNSTMTTPGLTPTPMGDSATCKLLAWPSGGTGAAVTDPANGTIATNPAFQRQQSRDSSSTTTTTTPTDADKLLSIPVPAAELDSSVGTTSGSGDLVVHVVTPAGPVVMSETGQNYSGYPSNGRTGSDGGDIVASVECLEPSSNITVGSTQCSSNSSDPRFHTYATVGEFRPSGSASTGIAGGQSHTTGVGGGSSASILTRAYHNGGQLPQLSLQLSHQTRQNYEMCNSNSGVPVPSLSTAHPSSMGTSSLISPPLPPADPNYSTGGRKMHLLPQYCEQANTTDV